jgi:hypothetical protein
LIVGISPAEAQRISFSVILCASAPLREIIKSVNYFLPIMKDARLSITKAKSPQIPLYKRGTLKASSRNLELSHKNLPL